MQLLKFTANWCAPCKQLKPIIKKFLMKHPELKYQEIDVDDKAHKKIIDEYEIMTIPALIFVSDSPMINKDRASEIAIISTGLITIEEIEKLYSEALILEAGAIKKGEKNGSEKKPESKNRK